MRSLRLRIAAILIGSILIVFVLAAFAMHELTIGSDPDRVVWPVASHIVAIDDFYKQRTTRNNAETDRANLGPERPDLTKALKRRLAASGIDVPVAVYDKPNDDTLVAIIDFAGEQVGIEFPAMRAFPAEVWVLVFGWLGLVVVGIIAVSLFMAYRITQPFVLLEDAVNSVGDDGFLLHIPERGSGEVRQVAAVLNRLSARLRYAMDSRMRLVAAAGHDLRTPLTRMRIRAEFLNSEDRVAWTKDIDELQLIADSAIRLVKEEVSTNDNAPLALDEMLRGIVEELRAQNYVIALDAADPVELTLPPLATKRALRNLLINAATHGRGGHVNLTVTPDTAKIEIRDNGPGIPPDLLSHVFEPFFRAEPGRLQTTPGAGLGLAIAKEIIERTGGKLDITNNPDVGLTQTVSYQKT